MKGKEKQEIKILIMQNYQMKLQKHKEKNW